MIRVAVNGFGRIGKSFVRSLMLDHQALKKIELVAINIGKADIKEVAYGFKYDTIMKTFPGEVVLENDQLIINNTRIHLFAEVDAQRLPWKELSIDWVVDATGHYTHAKEAQAHLKAGAKKVLISAPAQEEDVSIIPGVNDNKYDAQKHRIVSLGSCTTNALMPLLKVLHENFTITAAQVTTMHAYTNSQKLLDVDAQSKDPRSSRAAALNIIPQSTGASKMVTKIMPELEGKVFARAIRVPVANVSLIEITAELEKKPTIKDLNDAYKASVKSLPGIIDFQIVPLVSSDYVQSPYSVTVDGLLTNATGPLSAIFGWYDNEWGYSNRLKDFLMNI